MRDPNPPRWFMAGHSTSRPQELAESLDIGHITLLDVENSSAEELELDSCDAFILVISAKTGVSSTMIDLWSRIAERQIPRMIIVNGLELSEIDFDDIVLIANRVLENVITPYLVLHDELGEPSGLISLTNNVVHDYSGDSVKSYPADDELQGLVSEFREELILAQSEMDDSAFAQGLLVPAIPFVTSKKIGKTEIEAYAKILTTH